MAAEQKQFSIRFDLSEHEGRHAYRLYRLLQAFDNAAAGISAFIALTAAPPLLREMGRTIGFCILDLEDDRCQDVRQDPNYPVLLRGKDGDLHRQLLETFQFIMLRIIGEQIEKAELVRLENNPGYMKASVKISTRPGWWPGDDDDM